MRFSIQRLGTRLIECSHGSGRFYIDNLHGLSSVRGDHTWRRYRPALQHLGLILEERPGDWSQGYR